MNVIHRTILKCTTLTLHGLTPPLIPCPQALEALHRELSQYQPLSRRKRTTMGGIILFLIIVTGVTGILTAGAEDEFQRESRDPWSSEMELKKAHMMLSVCLSFLFFCVTLTIGLVVVWLALELYFYVNRRRIYSRAARRFFMEARRRSALVDQNQVHQQSTAV